MCPVLIKVNVTGITSAATTLPTTLAMRVETDPDLCSVRFCGKFQGQVFSDDRHQQHSWAAFVFENAFQK